ncbi:MAG: hypothetical protein JSW58_14520 [Candidatus Latescibacterota bacterium]|nr:MAG: hypothetical protein JSW58_14520 [Candidatus Latescibacterota bacterium]
MRRVGRGGRGQRFVPFPVQSPGPEPSEIAGVLPSGWRRRSPYAFHYRHPGSPKVFRMECATREDRLTACGFSLGNPGKRRSMELKVKDFVKWKKTKDVGGLYHEFEFLKAVVRQSISYEFVPALSVALQTKRKGGRVGDRLVVRSDGRSEAWESGTLVVPSCDAFGDDWSGRPRFSDGSGFDPFLGEQVGGHMRTIFFHEHYGFPGIIGNLEE